MRTIKKYLPVAIREIGFNALSYFEIKKWEKAGKPIPPPNKVKQNVVREYGKKYQLSTLVETGTYLGNMIFAQRNTFSTIYSIELASKYFTEAVKRFRKYPHIHIREGNSAEVLPTILDELDTSALFWLDGHFSGGETAESVCPVMDELNAILETSVSHVILIDDARLFNGKDNYPSKDELNQLLKSRTKSHELVDETDVIRITYSL